MLEALAASGLSDQAFADAHGIQAKKISYWRKRLGTDGDSLVAPAASAPVGFVPARVSLYPASSSEALDEQTLEVVFASGRTVRVHGSWSTSSIRVWLSALELEEC